jgi:hypothetical protein
MYNNVHRLLRSVQPQLKIARYGYARSLLFIYSYPSGVFLNRKIELATYGYAVFRYLITNIPIRITTRGRLRRLFAADIEVLLQVLAREMKLFKVMYGRYGEIS